MSLEKKKKKENTLQQIAITFHYYLYCVFDNVLPFLFKKKDEKAIT